MVLLNFLFCTSLPVVVGHALHLPLYCPNSKGAVDLLSGKAKDHSTLQVWENGEHGVRQ